MIVDPDSHLRAHQSGPDRRVVQKRQADDFDAYLERAASSGDPQRREIALGILHDRNAAADRVEKEFAPPPFLLKRVGSSSTLPELRGYIDHILVVWEALTPYERAAMARNHNLVTAMKNAKKIPDLVAQAAEVLHLFEAAKEMDLPTPSAMFTAHLKSL